MTRPDKTEPETTRPEKARLSWHLSWRVPVAIAEVPEAGRHVHLDAPEAARHEIATLAGLRTLDSLAADFDVTHRGDGLRVRGVVRARVGQTCVVTLEPLDNTVEETVDVSFSPCASETDGDKVDLDPSAPEPVEPMRGGALDLAPLAVEFMLLGLDPYPRKPGVAFEPVAVGDDTEEAPPHPFAGLAALQRGKSSGNR